MSRDNSKTVFACMACVLFAMCLPHTVASGELAVTDRVSEFLAELLGNDDIRVTGKRGKAEHWGVENLSNYDIASGKRKSTITVTNDGKELYKFLCYGTHLLPGLDLKEAISEDEAFERLKPVLEFYGFSLEKEAYNLELSNVWGGPPELKDMVWSTRKELSYNDVPCRRKFLVCNIFAQTGDIQHIYYAPVFPPKNSPTPQITVEAARKIAAEWANAHLENKDYATVNKMYDTVKYVIAPQENLFTESRDERKPLNTFYCWEFMFEQSHLVRDVSRDITVWINIEDGTVVGAWNRPKRHQ